MVYAEIRIRWIVKILIARALAQQTPILFLDEPTAFLDWPNRMETLLLLKEIAVSEKKAILFSSHDLELVMRFADVIWVLDDDRAFFSETREGILKSGALKNAFGGKYLEFLTKKNGGESTVPQTTERI